MTDRASSEPDAPMPEAEAEKARLRAEAFARRRAAHEGAEARVPAATANLLALIDALPVAPRMVAGYMPIRTELDPRPAMAALHARGAALCLPVVTGAAQPLVFRRWAPGQPLVKGAFGAAVPEEGAEDASPDLLILPLVAFDRAGGRLGYGGGFYDRTLERLRACAPTGAPTRAIGFAYAAQEAGSLPLEPTDQPMDALASEDEALRWTY